MSLAFNVKSISVVAFAGVCMSPLDWICVEFFFNIFFSFSKIREIIQWQLELQVLVRTQSNHPEVIP